MSFLLGQPSPDTERLRYPQGIGPASSHHRTSGAHRFRPANPGRTSLRALVVRMEKAGSVHAATRRPQLPFPRRSAEKRRHVNLPPAVHHRTRPAAGNFPSNRAAPPGGVVVGEDSARDQWLAANNWNVVPPQEQQVRAALGLATVEV